MNVKKNNIYTELAKPRITETRKLIISKVNNKDEHFKMVELAEVNEGDRKYTTILKGGIEIHSLLYVRNLRDALNKVLDDYGFYETENGQPPKKVKPQKFDTTKVKPRPATTPEYPINNFTEDIQKKHTMPYFKDVQNVQEVVAKIDEKAEESFKKDLEEYRKKQLDFIAEGFQKEIEDENAELVKAAETIADKAKADLPTGLTWNEKQSNKSSKKEDFDKAFEGIKKTTKELAKETDFEEIKTEYVAPDIEEDEDWLDEWDDIEDDEPEIESLPEGYEEYTINALHALCKERGIKTSLANKSRSYFINLLQKSVDK